MPSELLEAVVFGGPVEGQTTLSYICLPFRSPTQASQFTGTSSFYRSLWLHPLMTQLTFDDPFLGDSDGIQILQRQFPKFLLDKEMVGFAILNKHLSWNNLTSHRALLAQPVSKNIFQNHKLEILGLTEYGLRLEPLIRNLLTLRKGCVNCCR